MIERKSGFLGFGWRIATREARRRPKFWPDYLRVRAWRSLRRRWWRSPRLFWKRLILHQQFHFVGVDYFALQQRHGNAVQRFAVRRKNILCGFVAHVDDTLYFAIDLQRGVFAEVAMLCDFAAQEDCFFLFAESQWAQI